MHGLSHIYIENFRACRSVFLPLGDFHSIGWAKQRWEINCIGGYSIGSSSKNILQERPPESRSSNSNCRLH